MKHDLKLILGPPLRTLFALAVVGGLASEMAQAQTHTILKQFGIPSKVTGSYPRAPLVQGPDGALYGTASSGEGHGTVFKLQPDGTGFVALKYFTNLVEGAEPHGGLVLSGGTLYGTTRGPVRPSGSSGPGMTVFKVNTDGTGYTVLRRFAGGSDGGQLYDGLVLAGGTLYGTTPAGGSSGKGTVFKINTNGTGYTVLKSFTGSDGSLPVGVLVLSGGTLYGTTGRGGSSDRGTVFKMNTNGTGYTVLKSFTDSEGRYPGGLVLSGGTLYGITSRGGNSDNGTVFQVNTDGTGYTELQSFTYQDGAVPPAGLSLSGGRLYGTTSMGGSSGKGTVFKLNTDGTGYAVLKNFTGSDGAEPAAGLFLSGGTLYGTTSKGGSSDYGTVFKVNTDGTGYTVLKSFTLSDAAAPHGGPVLSGSTLYGTTWVGGSFNFGTVFKVNTDGTGYAVLKDFTGGDGAWPRARLVLFGGTLYGTTYYGGSAYQGTVFKMNTNGTGYAVLKSFTGSDGGFPVAGLVLSGSTLYGTTAAGGISGYGTVFKVNTNGTGFTVLTKFAGNDDGWSPWGALVLSDGTLYGTTMYGGSSDHGTVFKVNTDGTDYTVLRRFIGADGDRPMAGLLLSDGSLYGTTFIGGSLNRGTVFTMNTDGTGYTVLKNFPNQGGCTQADLVLSAGTIYGTTWKTLSADPDDGTVFKVNTDGTGFAVLKRFTGSNGSGPQALVLSGDTLYATTAAGGNLNNGTVFRIDLTGGMSPVIDSQPQSRTNIVGTITSFSVTAIATAPLTCQWRKNGVNLGEGVQSSGATISGTTATELTMANVQMSDAGDYTVVVTNTYGSVISSVAVLTVQLPTLPLLTVDGTGGYTSSGFGFNVSGIASQPVVIEASANLTSWTPLMTNSPVTNSFYFEDPDWTNFAHRFYRARLTP